MRCFRKKKCHSEEALAKKKADKEKKEAEKRRKEDELNQKRLAKWEQKRNRTSA